MTLTEIMTLQKRRRTKYRISKNLPFSYTEEIRNLINDQMEVLQEHLRSKNESRLVEDGMTDMKQGRKKDERRVRSENHLRHEQKSRKTDRSKHKDHKKRSRSRSRKRSKRKSRSPSDRRHHHSKKSRK